MTEQKRFTITQDFEEHHRQIRDNGYIIMGCFVEPQAEVIVDLLNQLNDENEQLKQVIQEAYTILKEADLFSDKATTHDTIAYKEMFKFDNKDSYSIAKGIKEAMKILKESG